MDKIRGLKGLIINNVTYLNSRDRVIIKMKYLAAKISGIRASKVPFLLSIGKNLLSFKCGSRTIPVKVFWLDLCRPDHLWYLVELYFCVSSEIALTSSLENASLNNLMSSLTRVFRDDEE